MSRKFWLVCYFYVDVGGFGKFKYLWELVVIVRLWYCGVYLLRFRR